LQLLFRIVLVHCPCSTGSQKRRPKVGAVSSGIERNMEERQTVMTVFDWTHLCFPRSRKTRTVSGSPEVLDMRPAPDSGFYGAQKLSWHRKAIKSTNQIATLVSIRGLPLILTEPGKSWSLRDKHVGRSSRISFWYHISQEQACFSSAG
jgi:hypothetical protein